MQEVFNWLSVNYRLVIDVVVFIAALVLFIVRKKPIDTVISSIYLSAVEAVKAAELTNLKGAQKLQYCMQIVIENLEANYPGINGRRYEVYIKTIIEDILSTPQKKGEK